MGLRLHNASLIALMFAVMAVRAAPAWAAGNCALIINGTPCPDGGMLDDQGNLLLPPSALEHGLGLTAVEGGEGVPWTVKGCGRSLLVRPDAQQYMVDDRTLEAPAAPELTDEGLAVPLAMLTQVFGIQATRHEDRDAVIWSLTTAGAQIVEIRSGSHRESLRLVVDLDGPACFSWWVEQGRLILELPAPPDAEAWARSVRLLRIEDPLIGQVSQGPTDTGVIRISIGHHSTKPPQVFSLGDPPRIVVDLLRDEADYLTIPEVPELPAITPGGLLQVRNFSTPRGSARVFVFDLDPRAQAVQVRPALAASTVNRRASVTRMALNEGAYGGVNAGFFATDGAPLGMIVIDGEWVHQPFGGRTVLGITTTGELLMDRLDFDGKVMFSGHGYLPLSAINEGHSKPNTLVMYTRRWGRTVAGAPGRTRLVVDNTGCVTCKECNGLPLTIPEGGMVLSGNGRVAGSLNKIEVGTVVTAELRTRPNWPNLRHAIGGGPRLVKDGREHITAAPERFRPDVYASIRPRTAAGITADGRLLLVVVEGGREGDGGGMSLQELAATMIKLGARQAMNLDGGGSSTFVAERRVINLPSDGAARSVSNGLLVFTGR